MHTIKASSIVFIICCCVFVCAGDRGSVSAVQDDAERATLVEFNRRVEAYATLHRTLEGPVPSITVSADPAQIRCAMDALAAKIVHARPYAGMGDFFTPDVSNVIRRIIRRSFAGSGRELLAIVEEEQEHGTPLPPRIHTRWPEGVPLSMVPPKILAALPPLPEELQYRFRSRHLVLWDMHADLVIDALPNAIQRLTAP